MYFIQFQVFLLLIGVLAHCHHHHKTNKRHSIVSRFSSNPFFLSHFQGYKNNDYEIGVYTYSQTEAPDWIDEKNDEGVEDYEEIPIYLIYNEDTDAINKETSKSTNSNEENVIYSFKSLPHFEQLTKFKEINAETISSNVNRIISTTTVEPAPFLSETKETEKPQSIYIFKGLPNYERNEFFIETSKSDVNFPKQDIITSTVKNDIIFNKNSLEKLKEEEEKNIDFNKNKTQQIYLGFKNLPHFDRNHLFLSKLVEIETTTLENKSDLEKLLIEPEIETVFNNLPFFDANNSFRKINEVENTRNNLNGDKNGNILEENLITDQIDLEKSQLFLSEPLEKIVKVETSNLTPETVSTNSQIDEFFKKLPLFENPNVFNPKTVENQPIQNQPLIKNEENRKKTKKGRKLLKVIRRPAKKLQNPDLLEHDLQFLSPLQEKLVSTNNEDLSEFFLTNFGERIQIKPELALVPLEPNNNSKTKLVDSYGNPIN